MSDRLAAADAELRAGRRDAAITLLLAELDAAPAHGANVHRVLIRELLQAGRNAEAEARATAGIVHHPSDSELHRQWARALLRLGRRAEALLALQRATDLAPSNLDAWLDRIGVTLEGGETAAADILFEAALAVHPQEARLLGMQVGSLRRSGRLDAARSLLRQVLATTPAAVWALYHLSLIAENPGEGLALLREALILEPENLDVRIALSWRLQNARGADEGADLEAGYRLIDEVVARGRHFSPAHAQVAAEAFQRVCAFDALDALGSFEDLGRRWAKAGLHAALLRQLPRVRSHADRLELLAQHRIWGELAEAQAARQPIERKPRPAGSRIRLGFMSTGLRSHVVGLFALPLFEHWDREAFEVFCYATHGGPEQPGQTVIAGLVTAYRWMPGAGARELAQAIADDGLDMLIEIGGSTDGNRLETLAWRPAPVQASWMGYPHSVGLAAVDGLICDPFARPTAPDLLLEEELILPNSWVALGEAAFSPDEPIGAGIASDRKGYVTYGTANNPYKFTRQVLRTWARIVARTPGSRFAFVRPEAGSPTFRRNVAAEFAAEGVSEARLDFHAVRGAHLPLYDEIDITLDVFPLTGGTTTAEALWMGVPVVSLVGEALYERLSHSLLSNAGLGDLCAGDMETYEAIALALADDAPRRRELKQSLRTRIRQGPLGDAAGFARDFYDLVARTVAARQAL